MKTGLSHVALAIALGLLPAAALAGDAAPEGQALTLAEAQHLALTNHPGLQAERFNEDAALQAIAGARAAYYPHVEAYADRVFAPNDTRIAANPGITSPTVLDHASTGLGIDQLITDFGRTDDEVDRAKLLAAAESDQRQETEQSVLLGATQAYFDVLRSQSLLRVAEKNLDDRRTLLKRVEAMAEARLRSDLDVNMARQVADQANLLVISAKGDRDAAMARLSQALGYGSVHDFDLARTGDADPPPPDVEALVGKMLGGNPDLAAARARRDAAYKNRDAAADAWHPTVSAEGYAGYSPIDNPSQHLRDTYVAGGLTLSVPLFTGGELEATEAEARDQARAAERKTVETENRLSAELRAAYATVRTDFDRIAVTDQLVRTARQSLSLMQTGFEIGRNSIVDLSQAELQATEAEIEHADARYAYQARLAELEFIVGDLQ